jgi:multicomponent K+:H+ antiporter subunit D
MQSLKDTSTATAAWAALLISGFVAALVMARAASTLFWEPGKAESSPGAAPLHEERRLAGGTAVALLTMVVAVIAVTLGAAPLSAYARATAEQLTAPAGYVEATLGRNPAIARERRP